MPHLPSRFAAVIPRFAPLFFQRGWRHAEVLLTGAILVPGQRTVTNILRIMGLNRAAWCPRAAPHQGQATGNPVPGPDRPGDALAARHRARLV